MITVKNQIQVQRKKLVVKPKNNIMKVKVRKHLRKGKNKVSVVKQHMKKKKRYNKGNAPGGNLHKNSVSDGADKFLKSQNPSSMISRVNAQRSAKKKASVVTRNKKKKSNIGRSYMLKSHKSKNIHLTISGRGQGKKGMTKNQKGEIKTRIRSLKAKK